MDYGHKESTNEGHNRQGPHVETRWKSTEWPSQLAFKYELLLQMVISSITMSLGHEIMTLNGEIIYILKPVEN